MARNIDDLPLYDNLVDGRNNLSSVWFDALASFILTLQEYLTAGGILIPQLTTTERDALQNVRNGQVIYNTTTNKFQGYENGAWANFI